MSLLLELRPSFHEVEEFAIEDGENASILIRDGLLAIRQTDDAEPPRG